MGNVFIPGAPFDEWGYDILKLKFSKDYQKLVEEESASGEISFDRENCAFLD